MVALAIGIVQWVILSFASYRITRFFVFDSLIGAHPESGSKQSARVDSFAYNHDGSNRNFVRGKIGDLLTCPWCLGFWISAACYLALVISTGGWAGVPLVVHLLGVFAVAGGQGFLNSLED